MTPESSFNFQTHSIEKDLENPPQEVFENHSEKEVEQSEQLEQSEALSEYKKENAEVSRQIQETNERKEELSALLDQVRESLYEGDIPENTSNPALDDLISQLKKLQLEKIKVNANYPGDWTLLLRERMLDPITKEKFVQTREAVIPYMKQGEVPEPDGISFVKPKTYAVHYQNQIDNYDSSVERIFSKTHTGMAEDFGQDEVKLGSGSIGEEGNVFLDSQKDGKGLTIRQKNIIEAHEKGHGLRDFVATDQQDFKHAIDFSIIEQSDKETGKRERGYLMLADEIAERMAQLKNYFGLGASVIFTKEHLAYAKENYVKDTELDNNMTTFLKAVTENTTPKFLDTINKYPL
jgi:hypothetical protein